MTNHRNKSTLLVEHRYTRELERLRGRATEAGYEIGEGLCDGCDAKLTEADLEIGACTQCGSAIESDSDDYDWYNANGLLDTD